MRPRTAAVVVVLLILLCEGDVRAAYTEASALTALYYAKASYCDVEAISNWSCASCAENPGFQKVRVFSNETHGTLAFMGVSANRIVISFRGTRNVANWLDDLDYIRVPYISEDCIGCLVHAGFMHALETLQVAMRGYLQDLVAENPHQTILITGHSLGGAMASLAAADFASWTHPSLPVPKIELYTFGAPRVGNYAFANWFLALFCRGGHESYRVTHKRDVVPHVPPVLFGFEHLPREIWYDNDGSTSYTNCSDVVGTECPAFTADENPDCSNSVIPASVCDHGMYLGVCTSCSCPKEGALSNEELRISPELEWSVAMDYMYRQSGRMRHLSPFPRSKKGLEAHRR